MANVYLIGDGLYDSDDERFEEALAYAQERRLRPLCLCREPGVPMYVAKLFGHHHIKRMPQGGVDHVPGCGSYEPPAELGGLGQLRGGAIKSSEEDGTTLLNLGFPFTKGAARAAPTPSERPPDTIKADRSRLTLLSTLHYLWDEAELTKWSPGMAGKRKWPVVRRHLYMAAEGKRAKGTVLVEHLYIPELFAADRKDEIASRRRSRMAKLMTIAPAKARPLMLLIAEVKELGLARYGHKMVVRHCPDFPFFFDDEFNKRLFKHYEHQLAAWNGADNHHLVVIALFSLPPSGAPQLEEAALMLTDPQWLPLEGGLDASLQAKLVAEHRRFVRGMRYNTSASRPTAAAVLHDTAPRPTALFIQPPGASDEYVAELDDLVGKLADRLDHWIWRADTGDMPRLPSASSDARLNATSRPPYRPLFLECAAKGEGPFRIVAVSRPRRVSRDAEVALMMVRVTEVISELVGVYPQDLAGVGRLSDLALDTVERQLFRLSNAEVHHLRELATARRAPLAAAIEPQPELAKSTP